MAAPHLAVAVSKTPIEKWSLIWKIEDFATIRSSKDALEAQKFHFEMGASIGLPTRWTCFLQCKEENDKVWIGVFVTLNKASAKGRPEVLGNFVSLKVDNGQYFTASYKNLQDWLKVPGGWGWTKVIPQLQKEDKKALPLDAEGTLSLELKMVVVNLKTVITPASKHQLLDSLENLFEAKFRATLQKDMMNMFNNLLDSSSGAHMSVKVISMDGKEIFTNRGILSARSPVFHSMFHSKMSEFQEGVIKMDDISGPALQAFLLFMHTGMLPSNWKEPEIVEDFTYAAHKYLLQELVEFLDRALGMVVCTPKKCVKLVELAKKLGMKTAEEELTRVLRNLMKDATLDQMRQLLLYDD